MERVVVVEPERLSAAWAAAVASDGRRVVFVRKDCLHLLDAACHLGEHKCPIWSAMVRLVKVA